MIFLNANNNKTTTQEVVVLFYTNRHLLSHKYLSIEIKSEQK